jgi:rare lipoprotein A
LSKVAEKEVINLLLPDFTVKRTLALPLKSLPIIAIFITLMSLFEVTGCAHPSSASNDSWMRAQGAENGRRSARSGANNKYNGRMKFSGYATYYSDSLAGHRTASGDRYNPNALTAASPNLPFGTLIRVSRPEKRLSVVVRINDRGPFGDADRILDLSRSAAKKLAMLSDGVVRVRVKVLRLGPQNSQARR